MMRYREPRTCATLPTVILNSEGVLTVEKKIRKIGGIYYVTEEVQYYCSSTRYTVHLVQHSHIHTLPGQLCIYKMWLSNRELQE